jgi:hypothetical protein
VPSDGAYLGAWVNPAKITAGAASAEMRQLPTLQQAIGRQLALLHVYIPFDSALPTPVLQGIVSGGAVPLLDWACAPDSQVLSGADDSAIRAFAVSLKDFGYPVFLRYGWEMNLAHGNNGKCVGGNPASFGAAWRRIHDLFRGAGATNVAFVWCPAMSGRKDFSAYYPGDSYVDWVAADGYDRSGSGRAAVNQVFGNYYAQFAARGKPMMIAETGAQSGDQAQYVQGLASVLPSQFPAVKALVWFDAPGTSGDWVLQGSGLQAFAALASQPYFSARA